MRMSGPARALLLAANGIYIVNFGPAQRVTPPYLSPEHLALTKFAVEEAAKRGRAASPAAKSVKSIRNSRCRAWPPISVFAWRRRAAPGSLMVGRRFH